MENETGHMCTVGRMDRKLEKVFTKMGWEMVYSLSGMNKEMSPERLPIKMENKCCNGCPTFLWHVIGACWSYWSMGLVQRDAPTLKKSYRTNWLIGTTGAEYGHKYNSLPQRLCAIQPQLVR